MSEKKVVRRRKVRRKKKQKTIDKKIWMIIGGVIAGLVIVYLAISVFFMSHFYINTQINGKNFSGKNAAAVENYIKNQVADYKLTIVPLKKDNLPVILNSFSQAIFHLYIRKIQI